MTKCVKCGAVAQKDSEYCYFCNPDVSEREKFDARSKGGVKSAELRRTKLRLSDFDLDSIDGIKDAMTEVSLRLASGKIHPSQARALVQILKTKFDILKEVQEWSERMKEVLEIKAQVEQRLANLKRKEKKEVV